MDSGGLTDAAVRDETSFRVSAYNRGRHQVLRNAYRDGWRTSLRGGKRLKGRATTQDEYLARWWQGFDDERRSREEGEGEAS